MRVWWSCVYTLHSSGIPKGWLCTSTGMVNHVETSKERKPLLPDNNATSLQRLLIMKTAPSQTPSQPTRPGPPPAPDSNALTSHDAEKQHHEQTAPIIQLPGGPGHP
ncbi:hypothetical protein OS493_029754 [Desmophyllum pertusum]|uniref:Uncharacterized protein n=1 Tax=Desmophyllum pertusum TaxID=174260 RepID=A0A9W9YWP9_9CNID|nr:hypothetical protein OS493_029754 [Desmophyllum pertusum]